MKLSIPTPCHENWSDMTPSEKGRFCGSCQKQVIDFTTFTDAQLLNFFKPGQGEVCGRFQPSQVNHVIMQPLPPTRHGSLLKSMYSRFLAFILTATITTSHASSPDNTRPGIEAGPLNLIPQNDSVPKKIRLTGRISRENGTALDGAIISIPGTKWSATTDARGFFSIEVTQEKKDQVFSATAEKPGFMSLGFQLTANNLKRIKVTMMQEIYPIMGAVAPVQR